MTTPQQDTVVLTPAVPTRAARRATWLATRHWIFAGVVLVAAVLPFVVQSFVVFQLTEVMIYGLAILGLNLLTGFNGQFSLGHGAFYGLGAYVDGDPDAPLRRRLLLDIAGSRRAFAS